MAQTKARELAQFLDALRRVLGLKPIPNRSTKPPPGELDRLSCHILSRNLHDGNRHIKRKRASE